MILELYNTINTILFVVLVVLFEEAFLERRIIKKGLVVSCCLIWFSIEYAVCKVFDNSFIVKVVTTIVLCVLFSLVLFKGRLQSIAFVSILSYSVSLFFDYITYNASLLFIDYTPAIRIDDNIIAILLGGVSQFLFFLTAMMFRREIKNKAIEKLLPGVWYKFSALPLFSLLVIVAFTISFKDDTDRAHRWFFVLLAFLLLAINIYAYKLFTSEINTSVELTRMRMNNSYAEELSSLYKQICDRQEKITADSHEYKNKIALIHKLIVDKNYESLSAFVDKEQNELERSENIINTGNPIITAIFNSKYKEAMTYGIHVRFDIGNLSSVNMKEEDLVIILFNILNNAIEACRKCDSDRRFINVKMSADSSFYVFVSNTYNGTILFENENYKSTKVNDGLHGFGIDNMKRIVESNFGYIVFATTDDFFTVRIMIPIDK